MSLAVPATAEAMFGSHELPRTGLPSRVFRPTYLGRLALWLLQARETYLLPNRARSAPWPAMRGRSQRAVKQGGCNGRTRTWAALVHGQSRVPRVTKWTACRLAREHRQWRAVVALGHGLAVVTDMSGTTCRMHVKGVSMRELTMLNNCK